MYTRKDRIHSIIEYAPIPKGMTLIIENSRLPTTHSLRDLPPFSRAFERVMWGEHSIYTLNIRALIAKERENLGKSHFAKAQGRSCFFTVWRVCTPIMKYLEFPSAKHIFF